jgi:hypothetical protein
MVNKWGGLPIPLLGFPIPDPSTFTSPVPSSSLGRCDGPSQDRCLSAGHADAGDANLRKTLAQRQITLDLYTMTIGQKQKYKIICRKKTDTIYDMYVCMYVYTHIPYVARTLSLSPSSLSEFLNHMQHIYIYSIYTKDRDRLIDRYGTANSRWPKRPSSHLDQGRPNQSSTRIPPRSTARSYQCDHHHHHISGLLQGRLRRGAALRPCST